MSRRGWLIASLAAASVGVLLTAPLVGMKLTPLSAAFSPPSSGLESEIFWRLRAPRVAVSYLAGAALALAGVVFQSMFRNPLATPFTLGVASGAALGASAAIRLGFAWSISGLSSTAFFAFAGAMVSTLLVYGVGRLRQGTTPVTMLLAGVAVSFLFSSVNLFIQYVSDFTQTFRIVRWLMGGLEVVGFGSVLEMLPLMAAGALATAVSLRELNLLATGEEIAASRGVDVPAIRRRLFVAVSLMVGGVVAVCGPIGFVGIMVPHIIRLLVGDDARVLAPASFLFGGIFLTVCDTAARTIIAPAEIPVGVITALLGGPFFLWLLTRSR